MWFKYLKISRFDDKVVALERKRKDGFAQIKAQLNNLYYRLVVWIVNLINGYYLYGLVKDKLKQRKFNIKMESCLR